MKKLMIFISLLSLTFLAFNVVEARPAEQGEVFPYQLTGTYEAQGTIWGFVTFDFNIVDGGDAIGAITAIGSEMFSFMDFIGIYELTINLPQPMDINIKHTATPEAPIIHQVIGATQIVIYQDTGYMSNGFEIYGIDGGNYENALYSIHPGSLDYRLEASTQENAYQNGLYEGFNDAMEEYGIYYNGQWITAEQYGNIRYNEGSQEDVNVFQILLNGFWSFLTIIGSWEVLPGFKIIHFIALPLVFGIIFFITGKISK